LLVGDKPMVGLALLRCADVTRDCLTDHPESLCPRQIFKRCLESPTSSSSCGGGNWMRGREWLCGSASNRNRGAGDRPELGHAARARARIGAIKLKNAAMAALSGLENFSHDEAAP
jgi:hypothetical protein